MAVTPAAQILQRWWREYWLYAIATLLVVLPLLRPGYILTLDLVFGPSLPWPNRLTSSAPLYALLHIANLAIPSQLIAKLLLMAALLLSGLGMHRLLRFLQVNGQGNYPWSIWSASLFYMVNPFTYDRFVTGQYQVLLGYSLLPWLLQTVLHWSRRPSLRGAAGIGFFIAVIGAVSLHTIASVVVLLVCFAASLLARHRRITPRQFKFAGAGIGVGLLASSYWLVPLLLGKGRTAETVQRFTNADFNAFATTGHNTLNQLIHVLRLQGFWAEGHNLLQLPQQALPGWGLVVLLLWIAVGSGLVYLWRQRRWLAIALGSSMLAAGVIALGFPAGLLHQLLPLLGGLREPQKVVAIVALGYAIGLAYGVEYWLQRYRKGESQQLVIAITALLLPLLLTPTIWWGARGQLQPRHYPPDWYHVDRLLQNDHSRYQILFLPWHQYMSYGFAQRIIASPGPTFFQKPVIASDDPELQGAIATTATKQSRAINNILTKQPKNQQLGQQLAPYTIKYVLVARDYDYTKYAYLANQTDLRLVVQTSHLILYRNLAWRE